MLTKYGDYTDQSFTQYKQSLINRIWCLIPLREEKCETIDKNVERLNREIHGLADVMDGDSSYLLSVIHLLENAVHEEDFTAYRADILRCCEIISSLGGDDDVRG